VIIRMLVPVLACLLATRMAAADCGPPAAAAEREFGIPPGLLAAIGRTETGRRDPAGRVEAWPWSINAAGQGVFAASAAEAVARVAAFQARGIRSIDVGCFQVNLLHHPAAFASLADAFDPARNATEAGRFLRSLRDAAGSWDEAVARYHSGNPALGGPYLRLVLANLDGGGTRPAASRVAQLVRVIVPGGPADPAGLRLPVVFVPSRLRN
jgi:hypothetical protein